jgi:hypothetical protein
MRPLALSVLAALVCAAAATAADDLWAKRANAVCRSWAPRQKAAFAGLKTPKTAADAYRFLGIARPLEAGLLRDLRAITVPHTAAATRALAAAANDVVELDKARAAYKARAKDFLQLFTRWVNDERATRAFAAAGAVDCA